MLGDFTGRSFLLTLLLNLFIFSSWAQLLLNKFIFKKFIKIKYWTFFITNNSENVIDNLDFLNDEKIKVIPFKDLKKSYSLIYHSYGIVIDNYDNLSATDMNLLLELKKKGIKIYKLSKWLEIFLKRYPPNLLN